MFINFSQFNIHGEALLINNTATDSGGGVYLHHSKLKFQNGGLLKLLHNKANGNGGGIYSWNSSIMIYFSVHIRSATIIFSRNQGEKGGGIYTYASIQLLISSIINH